jgi:hypothetical protein
VEKKKHEKLIEYLNTQKVFTKNVYQHRWQVGSSSFAPICVWQDGVTVKLNTDRKVFSKLLERVKNKFPFIKIASYNPWDGSCPPELSFYFDTEIN